MERTALQIAKEVITESYIKSCYYARVSSDEQKENETIESQKNEIKKVIAENGEKLVREYIDDGVSGALSHRPALDRLRDDAKLGVFNKVYILSPDRLSRELFLQLVVVKELQAYRIEIVFLSQKFGTSSSDKLLFQMLGAVSEFERAQILERTRRGRRYKAEIRQEFVGYQPPYGYSYTRKEKSSDGRGSIEIDDNEAKIVKMMFQWVSEGMSARNVVKQLTAMRVPTRRGGATWRNSSVFRILKRSEYLGTFYYNRVECIETANHRTEEKYRTSSKTGRALRPKNEWITIPLPHLRLISDSLFCSVQEQLKKNIAFCKRNAKMDYLLSGAMMKCQKCGSSYFGNTMHSKPFYSDSNKRNKFPLIRDCDAPSVSAPRIEILVWDTIVELLNNPDLFKKYLKETVVTNAEKPQELTILENQLKNLQTEEDRIIHGYQKGLITDEVKIKSIIQKIKEDKKLTSENIARINGRAGKKKKSQLPKSLKGVCRMVRRRLKQLDFEGRRQLIRELVKEILFDGKKVVIRGYLPSPTGNLTRTEFEIGKKI